MRNVLLCANIFAYALADRGYKIHPVKSELGTSPVVEPEKFEVDFKLVKERLGLDLSKEEVKKLLECMRYNVEDSTVIIPSYRQDIMHSVDVIEDVAIAYGYDNIEHLPLQTQTIGGTLPVTDFVDDARIVAAGLGFQEVFSAMLSNKNTLYKNMNTEDIGTVEIEEYTSITYSVVRSWLLPILMEALSKNKHNDYPQRLFEQGLVCQREGSSVNDVEKIAFVSTHKDADFTEMKASMESLAKSLAVEFEYEDTEHSSFIPGRCCKLKIKGKEIGIIGEVSPQVLSLLKLELPVSAAELSLSSLLPAS
jgi:phenylalanyl-tRNA synthetase beta chain